MEPQLPRSLLVADRWTAALRIAGAGLALVLSSPHGHAQGASAACADAADIAVLSSPVAPWKGAPLRVLFVAEKPIGGALSLIAPDGRAMASSSERRGGPPYFWLAEVSSPMPGKWQARLARENAPPECAVISREIVVRASAGARPGAPRGSVWPVDNAWNRATENLYSAWIEKLFDAPLEASLSWPALHEVLRDRSRNLLFNHLGLGEDQMGIVIRPDCADLPYFLRAYFAFKMGLPFGYSTCTRGDGGQPPRCHAWWNIQNEDPRKPLEEPKPQFSSPWSIFAPPVAPTKASAADAKPPRIPPRPPGLAAAFGHYLKWTIAEGVHSGSGRTAAADNNTDYYPVPLTQDSLRPGTVYADPYGHLLVLVRRVPQTSDGAGVFLAVDAQPDGTVARKRFWRGNFLFAQDPALGSPGFKRFRPVMRDRSGTLRRLANAEIAKDASYGDFSLDQSKLKVDDFYDRMDDLMSPAPLDPVRAMKEAITSLDEQVKARVTSVENGRKYQMSGRGDAAMPDGAAIFETTGAWEDFATPSRDLRLLIAVDVVRGFPERVARRPERYAMPAGTSVAAVKSNLEQELATELTTRKFSYPRSDGSAWTLTLKDVVERARALEMAYNVNDCVELRWGAPDNSEEKATCRRRAPQVQLAKMAEYRAWFHERRRPPRP